MNDTFGNKTKESLSFPQYAGILDLIPSYLGGQGDTIISNLFALISVVCLIPYIVVQLLQRSYNITKYIPVTVRIDQQDILYHAIERFISGTQCWCRGPSFKVDSWINRDWEAGRDENNNGNNYMVRVVPDVAIIRRTTGTFFIIREDGAVVVTRLGLSPQPIQDFIGEIVRNHFARDETRIFRPQGETWKVLPIKLRRKIATVDLDSSLKNDLLGDIKNYLSFKTWRRYKNLGLPIRRGYLLYGPPGTGKSSFIVAAACEIHIDIYHLSFDHLSTKDVDLDQLFLNLPNRCILLVEDIDKIKFSDDNDVREGNTDQRSYISKSTFLNALDGAGAQEGRILFMTTNHRERLSGDLLRPGRIDKEVEFGYASREQVILMVRRFFKDSQEIEDIALKFSERVSVGKLTTAQLQEFLLRHWDNPKEALCNVSRWISPICSDDEAVSHDSQGTDHISQKEG